MGLLCSELRLSIAVFRYGVEDSVLHKNADCSTYEGGEEVNVDVVACAVETPGRTDMLALKKYPWFLIISSAVKRANIFTRVFCFLLEIAEDGDCHQQ